jgi:hypothetical protein
MAELKTKPTKTSVTAFLSAIPDPVRRKDARAVAALMRKATGESPVMWGTTIVGYGQRRLRYASGRELDWMLVGFSPRAGRITLYLSFDLAKHAKLLGRLGKHSHGKGCLHLRRLEDVDPGVLEELVRRAVGDARARAVE